MNDKDTAINKLDSEIDNILSKWCLKPNELLQKKFNVRTWLYNFELNEIPIIFKLLDRIDLQKAEDVTSRLKKICEKIKSDFPKNWREVKIFGLGDNPSSSGSQYLYELRGIIGLSDENFENQDFFDLQEKTHAFVFIDDFIGSGKQASDFFEKTLKKVKVPCHYYSVFGFEQGIKNIIQKGGFKKVFSAEVLTDVNRAFSKEFNLEDMKAIKKIAFKYGKILYKNHPLGYEDSQCVITFSEGCPNNTLPIIWASVNNEANTEVLLWNPLFERKKLKKQHEDVHNNGELRKPAQFSNPDKLVKNFYNQLIETNYHEAFGCLSDKLIRKKYVTPLENGFNKGNNKSSDLDEAKYKLGFAKFLAGYKNTKTMNAPEIKKVHTNSSQIRYLVHYEEVTQVFKYKSLHELMSKNLKDLGLIHKEISDFRKLLKKQFHVTDAKLNEVPYHLFFSANVVEDVCWHCDIDYWKLRDVFESKEQRIIKVKYVDCRKPDKYWFIDGFSLVNHSSD